MSRHQKPNKTKIQTMTNHRNRHLTGNPHPQPLSHPLGEGSVGHSPVEAERMQRLRFTEPRASAALRRCGENL